MKELNILFLIFGFAFLISCDGDKVEPGNYVNVSIDGTNYTFTGGSIHEPLTLLNKDTLKHTTYLGGFIGTCLEGSQEFIDIRINQVSEGEYDLSDGIEFWMQTNDHHLIVKGGSSDLNLNLNISEYGNENERISGSLSIASVEGQVMLAAEFSLQRLSDHSTTLEVATLLCD